MTGTSSGRAGVPLWSAVYIDGECPVLELRRNVHVYGLRPAGIVENRAVGHSHSDLVDWASRLVREHELVHAILHILDVRKSSNPDREVDEREPGVRHPQRVNPGLVQADYLISRGVKEVGVNFAVYALYFEPACSCRTQCRRFFVQHPKMQPVAAYDTAGSVKAARTLLPGARRFPI